MDIYFTCIVVDCSAYENHPFIRHYEPKLLISMYEVCVYIGKHDHVMPTIIELRQPPKKGYNTY